MLDKRYRIKLVLKLKICCKFDFYVQKQIKMEYVSSWNKLFNCLKVENRNGIIY